MISNVFLYKNHPVYPVFFNPDLRQDRIKFALFTSCNPDFSPLTRCKVYWLVFKKDPAPFKRNTSVLTITNERSELS